MDDLSADGGVSGAWCTDRCRDRCVSYERSGGGGGGGGGGGEGGAVLPCGAAAADDCRRDQRIDRPRTAQRSAHQLT